MVDVHITLEQNHISLLQVEGHAVFFPINENVSMKAMFTKKKVEEQESNIGNVPCAAISVLCKSFVDSLSLYALQKKTSPETMLEVVAAEEGSLKVKLQNPDNDPQHVYRYALEQMLIVGLQAVAKEYKNDIKLNIKGNK